MGTTPDREVRREQAGDAGLEGRRFRILEQERVSYSDGQTTNDFKHGRAVVQALHEVIIPESYLAFKDIVKNTINQPNKCMTYQNLYYLAINLSNFPLVDTPFP